MMQYITTRKIQKHGVYTSIVALPKEWLVEQNINPGDRVLMTVENNVLKIEKAR